MTPTVTHTALNLFQQCEQRYYYKYVAADWGVHESTPADLLKGMIYTYLCTYYSRLYLGQTHAEAHVDAQWSADRFANLIDSSYPDEYQEAVRNAHLICDHYYQIRAQEDAETCKIKYVNVAINEHDTLGLITEDRITGDLTLWEHKIGHDLPAKDGVRLRDLRILARPEAVNARTLRLNYIRTEVPSTPKTNKDGSVSRVQIATTWPTYASAVLLAGGNLNDYDDMRQKLEGRETGIYFPRIDVPLNGQQNKLYKNAEQLEYAVIERVRLWQYDDVKPIRHFSSYCDSCEYQDRCRAYLFDHKQVGAIS